MAKNYINNKAIFIGLFMFATAVFSFTGFNDIYAQTTTGNQSSGNQSSASIRNNKFFSKFNRF